MFSYTNLKINLKASSSVGRVLALFDSQHHIKANIAYTPIKLVLEIKAQR